MRFLFPILSLLPLAMGLPQSHPHLIDRANDLGSQVREQINVLNSSVTELTTAVKNFDGSLLDVLLQSLAIISAETKIDATTLKTAFPTTQSSNFTEEESSSIVTTLASLITPITGSITALSAKYSVFRKTLEGPIVLLDLKVLKAHTDDLIVALEEKVTSNWTDYLSIGKSIINQAFNDAIAVYEG